MYLSEVSCLASIVVRTGIYMGKKVKVIYFPESADDKGPLLESRRDWMTIASFD
jgi:hypothetical protein